MNGNADWTITADIDMIRTNGENDPARGWAGQVQVENDEGNFDNEDAHKWVWRQDWWGWGYYNPANGRNFPADQVNKEGNCGGWVNNFDNDFDDYKGIALNDCNLLQTISFSHETGKVTIVTVITPMIVRCKVKLLLQPMKVLLSQRIRKWKLVSVCYSVC